MKRIKIIVGIGLAILLISTSMKSYAYSYTIPTDAPRYCENCGTALLENGMVVDHFYTYHEEEYQPCTFYTVITKVILYCPNGHGQKWSKYWHEESHSFWGCIPREFWYP